MKNVTVEDVIRHAARELLTNLSEDDVQEIKQGLIDSGALESFIREMEGMILKKLKESN